MEQRKYSSGQVPCTVQDLEGDGGRFGVPSLG